MNRQQACTWQTSSACWESLNKLVDAGHTVLLIEHHLDVIKTADHVIDLGPEGWTCRRPRAVVTGAPEEIAACKTSHTGRFLKAHMRKDLNSVAKEEAVEILSIDGREVRVTHPGKLYYSRQTQVSKLDLVRYYLSVARGALGGIADRPIVIKRFVNGAEGEERSIRSGRPPSGRNGCARRCFRSPQAAPPRS